MADKDQDIRNKVVDCSTCPNVQIYENETVIFFQVEGEPLRVIQKGSITMQYKDGTVVFYENNILLFEACSVENVRKANNDIYAETYLELVTALSDFLGFSSGGGGGIANVANGLYDDGGTAKLGGELVEDTTILGSDIYSLIFAFLDNFIAQGDVLQLIATSLVDVSSDDAINIIANGILQLTSANQINIDSSGAIRLDSNANEVSINGNSLFYFGDSTSDGSFRIGISGGAFILEQRILGVWTPQSFSVIANNGLNYTGGAVKLGGALLADTTISGLFQLIFSGLTALRFTTDVVQQQATGFYYFGDEATNGSFRIGLVGGSFVIQKRIAGVWVSQNIAPAPVTIGKDELIFCDSFVQPAISSNWFSTLASGGNVDLNQTGETGVIGIARFTISNSTSSRYGILAKGISGLVRTYQDGTTFLYKTKIRPEALGSLANRFVINMGFLSSASILNPIVGLYFSYDFTDSQRVNPAPANWSLVSRVNNVDKVVLNSGVPVVIGVWTKLAIQIDTATNTAMFYINGTLVGSIVWNGLAGINSNLPMVGASTECSWGALLANAGVAALGTGLRIDYVDLYKDFI
jgi:hypothetical protein